MSNATRNNTFDERYAVPLEASRRGAHRARRSPLLGILPFALVLIVVLGVGFAAFSVFAPGTKDDSTVVGALDDTTAAPTSSLPASAAATAPAASTPADTSDPSVTLSESPSESPATVEIDKTVRVKVLNGSGTDGLARKASAKLTADDWTKVTFDSNPETVDETVVYYAKDSQEASADALADALGHPDSAKRSATKAGTAGITVVIGADYQN